MKKSKGGLAVAAIDLGSNSFHLVRADRIDGHLHTRHRLKVRVQLAQGLDAQNRLDSASIKRGLAALERFQEHVQDLPPEQIKVVGTHTLRQAINAREFLKPAAAILGSPVQVISGAEEGRLTFQGVALTQQIETDTLLVDIGGGSTELVLGNAQGVTAVSSRSMGCVVYQGQFFQSGERPQPFQFAQARNEARLQTEAVSQRFVGFQQVLGSSGTIKAIAQAGEALGQGKRITAHSMELIEDELCALEAADFQTQTGISADRYAVLPPGLAVLQGVFEQLNLEHMEATEGALREGLLGQFLPEGAITQVRDTTIDALQARFKVDVKQARRVRRSALSFAEVLGVKDPALIQLLQDAADVHELGQSISYSDHHEHGAYLLTHSDLPGFHRDDQTLLASLVGLQRKRLPDLSDWPVEQCAALAALRLAILSHVSRREGSGVSLLPVDERVSITEVEPWRVGDFEKEAKRLRGLGLNLRLGSAG